MEAVNGDHIISCFSLVRALAGEFSNVASSDARVYVSTIRHFASQNAGRATHPSPELKCFFFARLTSDPPRPASRGAVHWTWAWSEPLTSASHPEFESEEHLLSGLTSCTQKYEWKKQAGTLWYFFKKYERGARIRGNIRPLVFLGRIFSEITHRKKPLWYFPVGF